MSRLGVGCVGVDRGAVAAAYRPRAQASGGMTPLRNMKQP
jgi:hypothetical protein